MALHLHIDAADVTLRGTEKGNQHHRDLLPPPWSWSHRAQGYVLPRSLLPLTRQENIRALIAAAAGAGIDLQVHDTGATLSEAARRQDRAERLDVRADRHEAAADRAAAAAVAADIARHKISDHIPPDQPILVDHYSAAGHRRALERIHRLDQQSLEAERTAYRRARLAAGIRRTLEHGDSPLAIHLRITRDEATIRRLERTIARYPDEHLSAERTRLLESVEIDKATLAQMETEGLFVTYSRDTVSAGDEVKYGSTWYPVLRANPKSVTVPRPTGGTGTLLYAKITGHRPNPTS